MNVRDVGIIVDLQKVVNVEEIATREELISIFHSYESKSIIIETRLYNSAGDTIRNDTKVITDEYYDSLVADGFFNEKAVWTTLDQIQSD